MRRSIVGFALILALFGLSAEAQSIENQDPVVFGMMQAFKIDEAEAKQRIAATEESVKLVERLEREEPTRFGGTYVEHSPNFRIVVKLVGAAEGLLARYTQNPLIVAEKAQVPMTALRSKEAAIAKALQGNVEQALIYVDARSSKVKVAVKRGGRGRSILQGQNLLTPDVDVEEADTVAQKISVLGGRGIKNSYESASLGFSVMNPSGVRGVLTAGHFDECESPAPAGCVKNQTATYVVDNTQLTFRGQSYGGANDFEWRSASTQSRHSNVITYGGGSYGYANMTITAVGTFQLNQQVCKQGNFSFYTCGTVTARVTYTDGPLSGYFYAIKNNAGGAMAVAGDSGGPVFGTNTAYGLNTVVVSTPLSMQGQLLAMPIQQISSLNLAVLTFP